MLFKAYFFLHSEDDISSHQSNISGLRPNADGCTFLFPQNEEALKKCAQDYLTRVKQEEQRYQALKVHAEEKLDK